jgi:hypothetical protein
MKTKKGKILFEDLRPGAVRKTMWKLFLTGSCLPLLFAGCVHWPDIAYDCESYGVREDNQPMGPMLPIEALYRNELDVNCAGVKEALARIKQDAQVAGCVVPQQNGTVAAYYGVGDRCAMNHELCHVKHGTGHTERYDNDLKNGIPMPYCPVNQLSFKG